MALNPFTERGVPLEQQWEPIKQFAHDPYDKDRIDELSRLRVIAAYGLEAEQWIFYHQLARHTDSIDLRALTAKIRRTEDQHRAEIGSFFDPTATIPQLTIAYEHLACVLTADAALDEPDPYVRQVFDFGLLEDYDHLLRFSLLLRRLENVDANKITGGVIEIKPGRPTWEEHRHPVDDLRRFYDARTADPLTKLHSHAILAAEQQTRQYYAEHGYWVTDPTARQLYAEIGQIEEQHVTQYEAIIDPRPSWLEMAIAHEYSEIYTYNGFLQEEKDAPLRRVWEGHLMEELEHLRLWNETLSKMEGKDARQQWPEQLPKPVAFGRSKEINDYIQQVLSKQVDLRTVGDKFVMKDKLPSDWATASYRRQIQADQMPSLQFQHTGPSGGLRM